MGAEDPGAIARLPKHVRVFVGFTLLGAGGIMALPLVPGPGIAVMILGLVVLSRDYHWAGKTLDWAKRKWHRVHPPDKA